MSALSMATSSLVASEVIPSGNFESMAASIASACDGRKAGRFKLAQGRRGHGESFIFLPVQVKAKGALLRASIHRNAFNADPARNHVICCSVML